MNKFNLNFICNELIETFFEAGEKSISLRNKGLKTEYKTDNTPVSNGDIEVNELLIKKIEILTPNLPIVSEESSNNKNNNNLENFWLIDPIDGTYDYINGGSEFTLNAALILNKRPELGVIYAPAKKRMFYTYGVGDCYERNRNDIIKLDCSKKTKLGQIKAIHYSDNLKPVIKDLYKKYGVTEHQRMKSSLKFCVIASSEYDIYITEPRASEWDIAAGHAILKNAGGIITDFDNKEILYGKKNFKNPSLILKRGNIL